MDMAILDFIHMAHMLDMELIKEHMDTEDMVVTVVMVASEDMGELINGEDIIRTMPHGNLDNMEHILALKINLMCIRVIIQILKLMMDWRHNLLHLESHWIQDLLKRLRIHNPPLEILFLDKPFNISIQTDTIQFSDQELEVFQLISLKKLISILILFLLLCKRESNLEVTQLLKFNNLTRLENSSMTSQNLVNLMLK